MARSPHDNTLKLQLPDGSVVTGEEMLRRAREGAAARTPAAELVPAADLQTLLDTVLLLGGTASINAVLQWLAMNGRQRADGSGFDHHSVRDGLQVLAVQRRAEYLQGKGTRVPLEHHAERLQTLLRAPEAEHYWRQRLWLLGPGRGDWRDPIGWVNFRHLDDMHAVLRLMVFSGMPAAEFHELLATRLIELSEPLLAAQALLDPWLPGLLPQIDPELRNVLLGRLLDALPPGHTVRKELRAWLKTDAARPLGIPLRTRLAEADLLALDLDAAERQLQGLEGPGISLLTATRALAAGRWAEASAGFEAVIKTVHTATRSRRGALSLDVARLYLLGLIAQDDPKAWAQARKYAISESGSRSPTAYDDWGLWAHGIGVRLGEDSFLETAFTPDAPGDAAPADRLLLCAWLGKPAPGWTSALGADLLARLRPEQALLAEYVAAALHRLQLGGAEPTRVTSMLSQPRPAWRDALAAIAALSDDGKPAGTAAKAELAWQLTLDAAGRVHTLAPLEMSTGVRGGLKFKAVTLARLKKQGAQRSRDNLVLRHIERDAWAGVHDLRLDVSAALVALIGHPHLMLAEAPGQWVELAEGLPELEVRRVDNGDSAAFEFRLHPPLITADPPHAGALFGAQAEAERERRNTQRVVIEGAGRARLIRITPTQRRVAELVAQGWQVPAHATAELGAALQVLTGHFQLHSDAEAGQRVAGDSRLHARLTPQGDGLQLLLVAQPFGHFGPAVTPGQGRERLMCLHEGVSLATERDLALERQHRVDVIAALPFLDPEQPPDQPWLLADAEDALAAVERLPGLPGIAALAWPKGKPVRVLPVDGAAVQIEVSSGRDWLALTGKAHVDEGRVLGLQELLALSRASQSRFVRLAEGHYLALSEQLRQQLRDLDALGQTKKGELQLPAAGAAWLERGLAGVQLAGDAAWRTRVAQLEAAAALQPELPKSLRAELRRYQADGFAWMSRLAAAGFGACLADDMGLGKTVQTLALLIERSALGPALVLAPTSVCGNWAAECAAFAPGLTVQVYADAADRTQLLQAAGPGDVIVASYALAQIDADGFAARHWASLVLDEAQALKNAATKRAKSVAEFQADFRLALSGTPVENRLADLWSIMNLVNPGLLGSQSQFSERFAGPIERQQDAAARARLRRLVAPFLLRRTKAQVLQDLPPRTEIVHRVEPSEQERHFLEALRRDAQAAVAQAAADPARAAPMQVLAELMRLRRAACDPRLVSPELGLVGSKMAEFEHIVRELVAGGHKALVFSQFTDYLDLLAERVTQMGLPFQRLDGSTPQTERTKRVAAFQRGEGEVFLISLKAGGFGLNLTMADYVLIVDPWWNPAAEDQASGRAHRMGQQRPVTVYRLVTAGSVEERIIELHRDKRGLAEGMLEGDGQATTLDAASLAALLED
ncbi:DEAD/DEAH box helicase [Roseateles cellulosilyticus]|uniref:DEAD/DEAH box helicase n=1 Tax=Pelomonas cellulosilytica TaxID=2906762 RepID=A0ABS8Y0Y2_9BURK|nr:DEAD/DEAH box helicase [Pelomonas sp. P8]MCE4557645.1 DEAD/DEAH box helicase [Pelomonas sp. P8]